MEVTFLLTGFIVFLCLVKEIKAESGVFFKKQTDGLVQLRDCKITKARSKIEATMKCKTNADCKGVVKHDDGTFSMCTSVEVMAEPTPKGEMAAIWTEKFSDSILAKTTFMHPPVIPGRNLPKARHSTISLIVIVQLIIAPICT